MANRIEELTAQLAAIEAKLDATAQESDKALARARIGDLSALDLQVNSRARSEALLLLREDLLEELDEAKRQDAAENASAERRNAWADCTKLLDERNAAAAKLDKTITALVSQLDAVAKLNDAVCDRARSAGWHRQASNLGLADLVDMRPIAHAVSSELLRSGAAEHLLPSIKCHGDTRDVLNIGEHAALSSDRFRAMAYQVIDFLKYGEDDE